jgi:MFS family permease
MGVAAALTVLAATGTLALWNVLAASVASGAAMAVDAPARQVYVVDLVGAEGVASAVGLWEVALNASRVVGPGLGGALLAGPGATACFGVNAGSYLAPLVVLLRMKPRTAAPARVRGRGLSRAPRGTAYATPSTRRSSARCSRCRPRPASSSAWASPFRRWSHGP